MMRPILIALGVACWVALVEWFHGRRLIRVGRLAFGPSGVPRSWTAAVPFLRVVAAAAVTWGLAHLTLLTGRVGRPQLMPEGGYRHLVVAIDVSPSMQIKDAGPEHQQTRAQRAAAVLFSLLERIALDQMRISVVAFYNGAYPVVVDTYDLNVVRNILDDLPLDYAFAPGKTKLFAGLQEAAALAKPWKEGSTTLVLASDGDTVPDLGMPAMPSSIGRVLVIGVGDAASGRYIDGHQSRQDAGMLRQVAMRLGGLYHDGNQKHLASDELASLGEVVPMKDPAGHGLREAALAATVGGALVLAFLPVALAFWGAPWQVPRQEHKRQGKTGKPVAAPRPKVMETVQRSAIQASS